MREAFEETYDENDGEKSELFKAHVKYFEGVMTELIQTQYNSSIYDLTSLEAYDYTLLMMTMLKYTYELQQVIIINIIIEQ